MMVSMGPRPLAARVFSMVVKMLSVIVMTVALVMVMREMLRRGMTAMMRMEGSSAFIFFVVAMVIPIFFVARMPFFWFPVIAAPMMVLRRCRPGSGKSHCCHDQK